MWTEPKNHEGVDSYCLSPLNWAILRIFSVPLSHLGLKTPDNADMDLLEFLHCTPVGSKLGSYMPNMAMPDLNKF